MKGNSLLELIFALQDQVLPRHISTNLDLFSFVSDGIALLSDINISPETWDTIPVEMRSLFNYFHADALSSLISAARLCLHGCETDALALMRVVLENLTILDYIATKRLYHEAFVEIQQGARRGKPFSAKFSYKTAIRSLGITDRRNRLRGDMSTFGSHVSPPRLKLAQVQRGGSYHPKVGLALDNPRSIRLVLYELASCVLFAARVVHEFLSTYLDVVPPAFAKSHTELEALYKDLKIE